MCKCIKWLRPECVSNLNGSEVLIKLGIQWRQLIYGAVESAVVVTQDLTQEEGGKRYIYNNSLCKQASVTHWRWVQTLSIARLFPLSASVYLVNGFSQHLPHKLKQLQVVLVNVGRRWRIKPFISTGSLQKFNRADRNLLASFICCHLCYGDFCGHLASFWHTLNRLSAGLNTFLMISSRNSLNTPSWSIPASSTPRSLTNFTRMTPFMEFAGNRRSWSYPSLEQQIQVLLWGEF